MMMENINEITLVAIVSAVATLVFTVFVKWVLSKSGKSILDYIAILRSLKDLHPYFNKSDVISYTSNFIPTNFMSHAPSNYGSYQDAAGRELTTSDGVKWMINNGFQEENPNQFYLILADAGMGKTAFMINLYIRYKRKIRRNYDIFIFPISHPNTFTDIDKIIMAGGAKNTILLLDAFDEDREAAADWLNRLTYITDKVQEFRKIVITCRTQFFTSLQEEPVEMIKFYVAPFTNDEINLYLKRKFRLFKVFPNLRKIRKAKEVLNKAKDLKVRPMIVSYIQDLIDTNTNFKYSFQVYEELIFKWISRETERISDKSKREEFRNDLHDFSRHISRYIFEKWDRGEIGLNISIDEIKILANKYSIKLDEIEMTSKSLLNRNSDGIFKFSHKSIFEFYLAREYLLNDNFKVRFLQLDEKVFDQARVFISELSESELVYKFIDEHKIKFQTKLFTKPFGISEKKQQEYLHGHLKTLFVNEQQLISLIEEMEDPTFLQGLNNLFIRCLAIYSDSDKYDVYKLSKIWTLRRVVIFNGVKRLRKGNLINIDTALPECHISGYDVFRNNHEVRDFGLFK